MRGTILTITLLQTVTMELLTISKRYYSHS